MVISSATTIESAASTHTLDVVIGGYVYELQFCVENFPPNTEPTVIDMDPPIEDDDSQQDDIMEEDAWRQGL